MSQHAATGLRICAFVCVLAQIGSASADDLQTIVTGKWAITASQGKESLQPLVRSDVSWFEVRESNQTLEVMLPAAKKGGEASPLFYLKVDGRGKQMNFDLAMPNEASKNVFLGIARLNGRNKIKASMSAPSRPTSLGAKDSVCFAFERFGKGKIRIAVPDAARVFNGDTELTVRDGVCEVPTSEELPPNFPTKYAFRIQLVQDGKKYEEHLIVKVFGNQTTSLDYSDMVEPDRRRRTIEYWNSARSAYSLLSARMAEKISFATRVKNIRSFTSDIDGLAARGVDPVATHAIVGLANEIGRFADKAEDARSPSAAMNAFLRGLSGDPFGAAVDAANSDRNGKAAISTAVRKVITSRIELTGKYDHEFRWAD